MKITDNTIFKSNPNILLLLFTYCSILISFNAQANNLECSIPVTGVCILNVNACGHSSGCTCPEDYFYNPTTGRCDLSLLQGTINIPIHLPPNQQCSISPEICSLDENECGLPSSCLCPNHYLYNPATGDCDLSIPTLEATIYCVHDDGLNDSQFCYTTPPSFISSLGPLYKDCDIEALDTLQSTDELYAAAGDDTPRPSHLYYVNKQNGNIEDLGDIGGPDFLREIDALSFRPDGHQLWGWAQGEGLFVIHMLLPNPLSSIPPLFPVTPSYPQGIPIQPIVDINYPQCLKPTSEVPIIEAELVLSEPIEVEDITWNWQGDVLYAVENIHINHDSDSHGDSEDRWSKPDFDFDFEQGDIDNDGVNEGIRFWASDGNVIVEICHDLIPSIKAKLGRQAEIEALESLPPELFPETVDPNSEDLLVVGFHGPKKMLYAVIKTPSIPSSPNAGCTLLSWLDETTETALNDIEGIAYSPNSKP